MGDIIYVAIILAFFTLSVLSVNWCDRIIGADDDRVTSSPTPGSATDSSPTPEIQPYRCATWWLNDPVPVLPIDTERLHLRVMRPADAPVLAGYRALDEVAEFQDWAMPFSLDDAIAMLTGQEHLDDIAFGQWVQIAIEIDTPGGRVIVGDIAVGQPTSDHVAFVGYTLAPDHQGNGYASEAAEAIVDALFEHTAVGRIVATLDPLNHASMRVIEPLGFQFEGIARQSELVRGSWVDDMSFGLLRADRAEWKARVRTAPSEVRLVEIEPDGAGTWAKLQTFLYQRQFVATMDKTFADALVPEIYNGEIVIPWFRGIEADGERVGFVMVAQPTKANPDPYLWRLLIDRHHQRRGIGLTTMRLLIDHFRSEGATSMYTSFVRAPGGPEPLYRLLGFVPTGELDGEEIVTSLQL